MTLLDTLPGSAGKSADTAAELHPLLAERWSPRGFDPTHRLHEQDLVRLLEAARWAPSANNSQPWRFFVATRGSDDFARVVAQLSTGNRSWAAAASALVVAVAQGSDRD